ncbi:TIM barrel protein [uncultured Litoreibacter sp.]|uniref:hydroxypyruvate isomerase family protein n=1 Tax=uncultured Litoreibacter sp. TaxID=1392394 RepID=UPI00262BD3BD|nr:TIM barrel protein [uncultured Litoreibacter sp.]
MTDFSANLGFLWKELALPDAIRAAKKAGFAAVEMHWPYATPAAQVKAALDETGLPLLGVNTIQGEEGENGLCALPGRQQDAKASIDQAIAYADATQAKAIHVMAGFADGHEAHQVFVENLRYACGATDRTILIEPLNHHDAPGYFLNSSSQAADIIAEVGMPNLKLMFDCYHLQIMEGDLTRRLTHHRGIIGHIQFASVPERAEPDLGEVNYTHIFAYLKELGYDAPLGAEYKPLSGKTEAGLGWMKTLS